MNVVLDGLMIHPSLRIQFLVIVDRVIELRPDRDHETSVEGMNRVEHGLWVGEACCLESMVAPVFQFPVVPVLYDVVNRDMTFAEFGERLLYLL